MLIHSSQSESVTATVAVFSASERFYGRSQVPFRDIRHDG
jgi:hypothetical protein